MLAGMPNITQAKAPFEAQKKNPRRFIPSSLRLDSVRAPHAYQLYDIRNPRARRGVRALPASKEGLVKHDFRLSEDGMRRAKLQMCRKLLYIFLVGELVLLIVVLLI